MSDNQLSKYHFTIMWSNSEQICIILHLFKNNPKNIFVPNFF